MFAGLKKEFEEISVICTSPSKTFNLAGMTLSNISIHFRRLGLETEKLDRRIIHQAKLWLDSGKIFGECGRGFQRINVACPRSVLMEALQRLKKICVNR